MNFRDMTVKMKLASAFGTLAFAVLLIAGFSLHALSEAHIQFVAYVEGAGARATLAGSVLNAVNRRAIAARNIALATAPADIEGENAAAVQAHGEVQSRLASLDGLVHGGPGGSDRARALVDEMKRVESLYGPVALDIVGMARAGRKQEAATKINDECRPLLAQLVNAVTAYGTYTQESSRILLAEGYDRYASQRLVLIAICVVAFAAAATAGALITRSLTRALGAEPGDLGQAAQRIASGDLQAIAGAETATAGSVLSSLVTMQQSLANIVGEVRGASDSIANGSAEIANGNADLSQRTEQQAAALEETAATMDELGTTVRNNAENARHASGLASDAAAVALQGGEVVGKVVSTMKGIQDSSQKIADIIGVIDSIAFQTNILALNAAVEAARAGEQGRGFAVVATEVRNLAGRSAEAAKEIKHLIGSSVGQVAQGTRLVDQAGQTMQEIVRSIQQVSDIVSEISAASAEQSLGVGQVGEAVTNMDRATQQNAALVEESAAAAASLRHQAQQLVEAVGAFRLGDAMGRLAVDGHRRAIAVSYGNGGGGGGGSGNLGFAQARQE
jgi:methyl-accepting chemotaxis protein